MDAKRFILDQTTIKKLLTIYKLNIPDYQRNFVWKRDKKRRLLDSLFRGFPIGAITLYEEDQTYYIIDGLQRINTLSQYLSRPNDIIPFKEFYQKVKGDLERFLRESGLSTPAVKLKKALEAWYTGLNALYAYEKVSTLYNALRSAPPAVAGAFGDLQLVERLAEILNRKIAIDNDDIALIIYRGSKDDLPDLFKNINTGSVALSPYEILQAVWNGYNLDADILEPTYSAYDMALKLINREYEIDSIRTAGSFDMFKNLVGLNLLLCRNEKCDVLFRSNSFRRLSPPIDLPDGTKKYYENNEIAFEIYSTLLYGAPNKISKAMEELFHSGHSQEEISRFTASLNRAILEAVDIAIENISHAKCDLQDSKYHSLYVLAGVIISRYDIETGTSLSVTRTAVQNEIMGRCLDLRMHRKERWFVDENRQVGFFNSKIRELLNLKNDVLSLIEADQMPG